MLVYLPLERELYSLLTALLLIGLHHVPQRVIESLFAEQLEQFVATTLSDVFRDLRNHKVYALWLRKSRKTSESVVATNCSSCSANRLSMTRWGTWCKPISNKAVSREYSSRSRGRYTSI